METHDMIFIIGFIFLIGAGLGYYLAQIFF